MLLHSKVLSERERRNVINYVRNNTKKFRPEILSAIASSDLESVGNSRDISADDLHAMGPLVMHLSADKLRHMGQDALDYIIDYASNFSLTIDQDGTERDNDFDRVYRQFENNTQLLKKLCKLAFRSPQRVTTAGRGNLRKFAWLLPCAPATVCRNADTNTVQNNLDLVQFLPWSCGNTNIYTNVEWLKADAVRRFLKKGQACGRALVEKVNLNLTDWNSYKDLGLMMKCAKRSDLKTVFNHISCNDVENTVDYYVNLGVVPDQVVRIVSRRCLTANISSFDCATVLNYGAAASGLPKHFFKDVPTAELCNATCFEGLMKSPFPKHVKRFLSFKCKSSITINSQIAREMGSGIVDLPVDVLKNISAPAIMNTIREVKEMVKSRKKKNPREKAAFRQIAKKLKSSGDITNIIDSEDIVKELSIKDLSSSVTNVVEDLQLTNNTIVPKFSDFQNKFLMRKVIETEDPENMTESTIRNLKSLVTGLVSSQIIELNPIERTSIAVALCEQKHWPLKSAKRIFQTLILEPLLDLNSTHPISVMTAVEASNIGCECLMYIDPAYLSEVSVDTCSAICGGIGTCSRFRCLNPSHRARMLKACLQCMGVADSAQITADVMSVIGSNLLQQLRGTEYASRIASADLSTLLSYFGQGCLSKSQRDALKERLLAVHGDPSTWDTDFMYAVKDLVFILGEDNINRINKTTVVDIVDDIVNALVPASDESRDEDRCCKSWLNVEDKEEADSLKRKVFDFAKKVKLEQAETNAKRKKRSLASLTCSEISDIGDGVVTVTNAELQAISAEEFSDCLSILGLIEGWSPSQRSLLYEKAKTDIGDICTTMTLNEVASLGNIALAMPVPDIQCLNLDSDTVSTFGQLYPWSEEQLSALADRYVTATGHGANSFTSAEISEMGSVICGLGSFDLMAIPPEQLSQSGAQLGQLKSCPIAKLQALSSAITHADAYGPTAAWDSSTLSEVGILTAGLSAASLQSIPTNSIEGISVEAIPLIPAQNLAAMTMDQLQEFSETQANAVTEAQKSSLSTEKKNALLTSIYGSYAELVADPTSPPEDPGNSAGRNCCFPEVLGLLIPVLCLHFAM